MTKFQAAIQTLTLVLVLALGGVMVADRLGYLPAPPAPKIVDGRAIGKAYASALLETFAQAWQDAATEVGNGSTSQAALSKLAANWAKARTAYFEANVAPQFSKVVPDGTEPTTPAQRKVLAETWFDFAAGVRSR